MDFSRAKAYELIKEEKIVDIQSDGYILKHKKSGARIVLVHNDDDNKVFYVGFRTPPADETGVAHIIEHTVLCGSDKYPVKDPFIELVKGSLNTFLNAITYAEKTMYPVASCNDKDFQNLMDVYLDAVFHPNIYKTDMIFKQEGWHYELEDKEAPITINGVVYNEMKGAYSSSDTVLAKQIDMALFPDNSYAKDSGGNPEAIPELTYEQYLDFHRNYYHPSNSYIYLYGDMDFIEKLNWLDEEYLSKFEAIALDSSIALQEPFKERKDVVASYSISSNEEERDNATLSYNWVISNVLDKELYEAIDLLDYALISAPGAPLKKALIDAGIGKDVSGSFDNGSLQMVFSIVAKNANIEDKERFVQIIEDTLRDIVKNGINKESLLAGINSSEFKFREADFGQFPKGLLYGIQCMESWLFDDMEPFMHLKCLDIFQQLRDNISSDYFEQLIQKHFLQNTHCAVVSLVPEKGLNAKKDAALAQKLQAYKESLSEDEITKLVEDTQKLKDYQEEPSSKEELEKIPMLSREDIRREVRPISNIEHEIDGVSVIGHEYATNGIDYVTLFFDASNLSYEDVPYLGILRTALGYVDTKSFDYPDLANAINIFTGGISSSLSSYNCESKKEFMIKYEVRMKVLRENLYRALGIALEIITSSNLRDEKRIYELLAQTKSRLQDTLSRAGSSVASMRALSGISEQAYYLDCTSGINYYRVVADYEEHFEEKKEELMDRLENLAKRLFVKSNLMVSFTGSQKAYQHAEKELKTFIEKLPDDSYEQKKDAVVLKKVNEGFQDASQIQYVARVGSYKNHGFAYTGRFRILKVILEYDYLWNQVRVLGGAYGCNVGFFRSGEAYFVSYRDPNLGKTLQVFDKIPEFIRNFDVDDREMTQYIIGTFGGMDTPLYPEAKGIRSMSMYLEGITEEQIQRERDEVRNVTPKDIRNLADAIEAILSDHCICVIGNEENIEKEKNLFDQVVSLY